MTLLKRLSFVFLLSLFVFAYLYHFTDIPFFRVDDAWGMEASYRLASIGELGSPMIENGANQTHYFHTHPPVYYILLALVFKIFSFGIIQARLFSIFLAISGLGVFYLVLKNPTCVFSHPRSRGDEQYITRNIRISD